MATPLQATTHETSGLKRWLPLSCLLVCAALFFLFGLQKYLTFEALAQNHEALNVYVTHHLVAALLAYSLVYILVVALSIPGASALSIIGGFLFGWLTSGTVTILAATIGAAIVFQIVKTSLGAAIAERAGPFFSKLSSGFEKNAFNYILFLRLVPAVPFFAVNAVAGLARVNFRTFVLSTLIGIIPGSYVFAWLGRGLGSILENAQAKFVACTAVQDAANCKFDVSIDTLVTRDVLIALAALSILSLLPVVIKKLRGSKIV